VGIRSIIVVIQCLLLCACATNELTGRPQLTLISEDVAAANGLIYYNSLLADYGQKSQLLNSTKANQQLDAIANRLIQQAVSYRPDAAKWDWQVNLVEDDDTLNAFCMPGGQIAVYTGLIRQLMLTSDEIAQALGHEIGHALAGHGAEKMSVQFGGQLMAITAVLIAVSHDTDVDTTAHVATAAAETFIALPNSRVTEKEADQMGIELAARAGFNPKAAVTLWQKMEAKTGSKGKFDFFSTHPASEKRKEDLTELGKFMVPLYSAARLSPLSVYDWIHGGHEGRPVPGEGQHNHFYSALRKKFERGEAELSGNQPLLFSAMQDQLSGLYKAQSWDLLAASVLMANLESDLGYSYLSSAASHLEKTAAADVYRQRANQPVAANVPACRNGTLRHCDDMVE
jgi:Zn-dependent protease with chaperone function